jgi:hypothetical protein
LVVLISVVGVIIFSNKFILYHHFIKKKIKIM